MNEKSKSRMNEKSIFVHKKQTLLMLKIKSINSEFSLQNFHANLFSFYLFSFHLLSFHLFSFNLLSFHLFSFNLVSFHLFSFHLFSFHLFSFNSFSLIISFSFSLFFQPF